VDVGGKPKIYTYLNEFFSFFTFFFSLFCKNIWSAKKLQNYTSDVVGDGGRDLPSCPTTVGGARCPVPFQKSVTFLFELGWR
jgi:hypothetical protein